MRPIEFPSSPRQLNFPPKPLFRALPIMPDLQRILSATTPLTLASVTRGAQPLVMDDLARAATGRAVFIADNEAAISPGADSDRFFASELYDLESPARGCLPKDRETVM